MGGILLLQYSGEQNEKEKTQKNAKTTTAVKKKRSVVKTEIEPRKTKTGTKESVENENRTPKTDKSKKKLEKKGGKKGKNANTTKYKRKRKYNKKYGTRDPKAKNGDEESGRMRRVWGRDKELGANSIAKTTKPRKITQKTSLEKRRTNVVPTLVRRFSRLHPLNAIPPSLRL